MVGNKPVLRLQEFQAGIDGFAHQGVNYGFHGLIWMTWKPFKTWNQSWQALSADAMPILPRLAALYVWTATRWSFRDEEFDDVKARLETAWKLARGAAGGAGS